MEPTTKKALQEILKILSECPDVADRITITIKPQKLPQDSPQQQQDE